VSERLMSVAEIEDICLTPMSKALQKYSNESACSLNSREWHELEATKHIKTQLTVYRNGTFSVSAPEVEGKCGVFGKTEFRFDAWFTAGEDDLDCRGFIVDNADLYRYFMKLYSVEGSPEKFVSCELMVLRAVRDWRERWPMARAIMVRVWGKEEVTYVEARWER
jgi:hypothetical protein